MLVKEVVTKLVYINDIKLQIGEKELCLSLLYPFFLLQGKKRKERTRRNKIIFQQPQITPQENKKT